MSGKQARVAWLVAAIATLAGPMPGWTQPAVASGVNRAADVDSARALFERNLAAIHQRDRDAYLATYLESPEFARNGPGGMVRGFDEHAAASGESWPDTLAARDLQLVAVADGVVYGSYRYRVRYGATELTGISERVFVSTPAGWRIAVTTAFQSPAGTPPPPLALTGGTVIDGTGAPPRPNTNVVVRGGRIDCVGPESSCPVPAGIEVIDARGLWITPGLIDAHVHFSQTGWVDGRPDAHDMRALYPYEQVQSALRADPGRWFRAYLTSGVTGVFDVGGFPWTWSLRDTASAAQPHVAAAGPLLSTLDHWLNLPAERQFIYLDGVDAARGGVEYLAAHATNAVKVWLIPNEALDPAALASIVVGAGAAARERGVQLIVHATNLREAKSALRAGARMLVHSVDDQPVDDEFIALAKQANVIYCPTLTVLDGYRRLYEALATGRAPELDVPAGSIDPELLAGIAQFDSLPVSAERRERILASLQRAETRLKTMAQNLKPVHAAGIVIAMGTDAGNPLTVHGGSVFAEMEAMQRAGMSAGDVLVAATRNAARAMGRDARCGTIEPGKWADLLLVQADPSRDIANMRQLRAVMRLGELRQREELTWK
jgi:imidazolonepropionase-like amidohydrolase